MADHGTAIESVTRGRSGGRGGNVADLDQARDLQAAGIEKDRWTRIVREQIARTLVETEAFHADDLDALGVPVEHCNLIGLETAAFRNRGLMESTGVYRKVSHKAAKGRKAPIYRLTAKGRRELTVEHRAGGRGERAANATPSSVLGDPHSRPTGTLDGTGSSSPNPPVQGASENEAAGSGVASHAPEPAVLSLLPEPDPETWAA